MEPSRSYRLLQIALVVSSVVHAAIMAVQSFGDGHHLGHL